MSIEHTILFTVTPRAISVNTAAKPVSIFVSPRLDGGDKLGDFPDWVRWTRQLRDRGLAFELHCGGHTRVFPINRNDLRPELWEQLFNRETYVRSHGSFDDYSDRKMISFSMRDALSALKSVYQNASVDLALPDRGYVNRRGLESLVNGLQVHWSGREADRLREGVRARYLWPERHARAAGPLDSEGLLIEPPSKLGAVAVPFSVFHHMPTPAYQDGVVLPDKDKLLDFHQALTALNAYPALLRALGLVFDLDLPDDFVAATPINTPGRIAVRDAKPGWPWAIKPKTHPLETAYMKIALGKDELFLAAPRTMVEPGHPSTVIGLLTLDPAHFGLAQVDVDGGMHKAIMLAETLHPSGDHNLDSSAGPQEPQYPETFDPEATLPSLRSGGLSLFADDRALQLLQSIKEARDINDALANKTQPRPFYAEDLVRGYRLDVWESRAQAWRSLHLRNARYTVGDIAFKPEKPEDQWVDEGFVELAATQTAPGAKPDDKDLYLHEAIARWAGWSLSAPRPGQHLSRYANAKDAIPRPGEGDTFAENQPETPFRVQAEYQVAKQSLPALRFGARYRFRVRAVDLAGNGLGHDDKLADLLSANFALPRDPEGFAYLRFEPVPAPLIVIRDEAAVTEPGSAVDRIVIRTFNDSIDKDAIAAELANGERHILPPRAAIEMGERHGAFDDASRKLKSDPQTWKLIAARDSGELQKKKIIIKGRPEPVPDDGSNEYPVEPGDSVDPLPFFPDPLSRGAALRNLPGTPSGAIGKAVPDAGAPGSVHYTLLSDPNPRPGSATMISFGDSGDWEQTRGFRLALGEPSPGETDAPPHWDPQARALTVKLPKGTTRVVPLTSYMTPEDLKLMGVWQWLRQHIDARLSQDAPQRAQLWPGSSIDRIAHVLQLAVEGGHWMLTPPHLLVLVHAVQQPLGRPEFTAAAVHHEMGHDPVPLQTAPGRGRADPTELAAITAWRRPNSNEAYLLGALKIHGASTARVDLLATWDDPVDDALKWSMKHHSAPVEEVPLPTLSDDYLTAPGPQDPEPRYVGRYDPQRDQILFVRAGDNTTWEDFSCRHAAPRHVFNDTKRHVVSYTATASSRFRDYFDSKLKASAFTRTSEPVVVDVPASARPLAPDVAYVLPTFGWERQTETNLKRSVRFGGGLRVYLHRPWFSSGAGELLGVALWSDKNGALDQQARVALAPYFTQWGMDPIWRTEGLAKAPGVDHFADADESDRDVTLAEASARQNDGRPGRICVVGFAPQYDEERQLWYADLTFNLPGNTYMPFVRLALVRYQPHALADAKVSRVVLADFAQLTPDRSVMVTADPHHPRTIRVVVSGVAPQGPAPVIRAEPMPQAVSARPTRIRVRLQQHDPAIDSDLAWNEVPSHVATIVPEKDGPVVSDANLSIWAGVAQFVTTPRAGEFRLLIEEHEFISANYSEAEHGVAQQPGRLVYAEIIALDRALLSP